MFRLRIVKCDEESRIAEGKNCESKDEIAKYLKKNRFLVTNEYQTPNFNTKESDS